MERCKYCGEPLTERSKFCPNCGKPRDAIEEAEFVLEEPEAIPAAEDEPLDYVVVDAEPPKKKEPVIEDVSWQSVPPTEEPPRPASQRPASPQPPSSSQDASPTKPAPVRKKASKLSIWAFICSLTVILSGLGVILAIVDLVKGNKQAKHGLSKAALIIGGVFLLLAWIGNTFLKDDFLAPKEQTFAEITGNARPTAAPTKKAAAAVSKATAVPEIIVSDSKVVSIVYGNGMLAGLREDGTVTAVGFKAEVNHIDVSDWSNMVAISAPHYGDYLMGLRGDGTVAITGDDILSGTLSEIRSWRNMMYIYAGSRFAYGVRQDGTVAAVKLYDQLASYEESYMQSIREWTDIRTVQELGGSQVAYGRKADGTWVTNEALRAQSYWLKRYSNTAMFFGQRMPFGAALSDSGDVDASLFIYGDYDLRGWSSIQKMVVLSDYAVGLKKDGTILLAGGEHYDTFYKDRLQAALAWRDVVDIASEGGTLIGLMKDGSVKVVGNTDFHFSEEKWVKVSSKTQTESRVAQAAQPRLSFFPYSPTVKNDASEKIQAISMLQAWETTAPTQWEDRTSYARTGYITSLKVKGIEDEDVVWFALENGGIDWNEHAVKYAQKLLDDPNRYYSFRELIRKMGTELFTEEEMEYAARRIRADFQQNAIERGAKHMKSNTDKTWTQEDMVKQLEFDGFTHEEAVNAANKLGLKKE